MSTSLPERLGLRTSMPAGLTGLSIILKPLLLLSPCISSVIEIWVLSRPALLSVLAGVNRNLD